MQDKLYGKEKLLNDLKTIGKNLRKPVTLYLIGGCSLALKNIKEATKDVDAIFLSLDDLHLFEQQLQTLGYKKELRVDVAYEKLGTYSIMRHPDKAGFDLFHRKVCNMLSLTPEMIKRAVKYDNFNNLEIFLISNEDITIFKGITERPRDIDDIAAIIKNAEQREKGFNWDHIQSECENQAEHLKIEGQLYNRFLELFEKYQIKAPIMNWLKRKDIHNILKEAYETRKEKGLSHEQIVEQFKKDGFTKKEIEFIEKLKK